MVDNGNKDADTSKSTTLLGEGNYVKHQPGGAWVYFAQNALRQSTYCERIMCLAIILMSLTNIMIVAGAVVFGNIIVAQHQHGLHEIGDLQHEMEQDKDKEDFAGVNQNGIPPSALLEVESGDGKLKVKNLFPDFDKMIQWPSEGYRDYSVQWKGLKFQERIIDFTKLGSDDDTDHPKKKCNGRYETLGLVKGVGGYTPNLVIQALSTMGRSIIGGKLGTQMTASQEAITIALGMMYQESAVRLKRTDDQANKRDDQNLIPDDMLSQLWVTDFRITSYFAIQMMGPVYAVTGQLWHCL